MNYKALSIGVALFVVSLAASIYFTARPYVAGIHYGGCIDTVYTTYKPESLIYEYLKAGGQASTTYPDFSAQEYGCAPTSRIAVIPADLYALTVAFGIIGALSLRRHVDSTVKPQ